VRGKRGKEKKSFFGSVGKFLLLKILLPVIVVFAVAAAGYGYLKGSGLFPLKKVVFTGNKNLTDGELTALLGVHTGQNMLGLSKRELSERLLASPWIKMVAVRKEVLSGRIAVCVEERKPFVIIERAGTMWLASRSGRLLDPVKAGSVPFLPVVVADVKNYPDTFRESILLARRLKDHGYFARPVTIRADVPPEDLSMQAGGVAVLVGYGGYDQKLDKLAELEGEIQKRNINASSIDLRFANRVIVTPVVETVK
jgi:cell division septal protein FtsQ